LPGSHYSWWPNLEIFQNFFSQNFETEERLSNSFHIHRYFGSKEFQAEMLEELVD
jgi:hypothetical protein